MTTGYFEDGCETAVMALPIPRIQFPVHWKRPLNRHAAAVERATIAWMQQYGMGLTPTEAEEIAALCCGMSGGYSFPLASYATCLLVTEFLSLWVTTQAPKSLRSRGRSDYDPSYELSHPY